ncbi:MAG: hypothetical protein WA477_16345 [Candidatus Sulfotelmatobacter sp.]
MRLVYYSLANFPHDSRERQWIQSIRSLRKYNQSIPVWLLLFNGASKNLLREAERQGVHVQLLGDYGEFLQNTHTRGSVLALHPTFHKFLALEKLPLRDLTQLLYLDCDTFFFDDLNLLFDLYATHDWCAREEHMSLRSHLGYDPKHIDELLLQYICRSEKLSYIPPFNSGVCLLNRGAWLSLSGLCKAFLELAWRLLCGRVLSGHQYGAHESRIRKAVMDTVTDADRSQALPYPSANDWIIEQIALWLALGTLPNLSLGTFSSQHVCQGEEFENMLSSQQRCVLAHYYTGLERQFFSRVPAIAE